MTPSSSLYAAPPAASPPTNPVQKLGFCCFAAFLFVLYSRIFDFFLTELHIALIVSVLAFTASFVSGGLSRIFASRVDWFLLAFAFWVAAATPFSVWKGGSFEILQDCYKSLLVYFLAVTLITTSAEAIAAIRLAAFALLVLAGFALTIGAYVLGRLSLPAGRYANPNELGYAMLTGILFWWFSAHDPGRSRLFRLASWMVLPVLFLVTAKTGSRSVLITACIAALMMLIRYPLVYRVLAALFLVLLLVLAPVVVPAHILNRYFVFGEADHGLRGEEAILQNAAVGSTQSRTDVLKTSIRLTLSHPLFGVGPGMFAVAENAAAVEVGKRGTWLGTHNTYTEISSENGIPALIFWLGAMIACWRELTSLSRLNRAGNHPRRPQLDWAAYLMKMCLVVYAIVFLFAHIAYSTYFPTIAGLAVALARRGKAELAALPAAALPAPPPPFQRSASRRFA